MGNKRVPTTRSGNCSEFTKIISHNGKYEFKGIFNKKIRHVSHDRSISMTDFWKLQLYRILDLAMEIRQ